MADIIEIHDKIIFDSECQTIVNTVNCVGVMGRGLALEYKSRFPRMFSAYEEKCKAGKLKPGTLYLYRKSCPWILNFPTKNHWRDPSKIEFIDKGLTSFILKYKRFGISSIAFPKLGTQSGGLDWDMVRDLMMSHLVPIPDLKVEIYHFHEDVTDDLYNRFLRMVSQFKKEDFMELIGLKKNQAALVFSAVNNPFARNMDSIQRTKGIGKKTIEKIYKFVLEKPESQEALGEQIELFQ